MKKSNPLFVDSTKFSGDAIFTQVELEKIPPYLGETVSFVVTDKNGAEQETVLDRTGETQCSGQVFLRHQQEITYQFFVSRNGERIFYSEPKTTRASYLIHEVWTAVPVNPSLLTDEPSMVSSVRPSVNASNIEIVAAIETATETETEIEAVAIASPEADTDTDTDSESTACDSGPSPHPSPNTDLVEMAEEIEAVEMPSLQVVAGIRIEEAEVEKEVEEVSKPADHADHVVAQDPFEDPYDDIWAPV